MGDHESLAPARMAPRKTSREATRGDVVVPSCDEVPANGVILAVELDAVERWAIFERGAEVLGDPSPVAQDEPVRPEKRGSKRSWLRKRAW